jgi:CRISPR-associated protein Csb2
MASSLALSFRFLDPRFHGRRDGGEPEWPPSPLRAFQALIAAAATMHRGRPIPEGMIAALGWLESVCASPPSIVAPPRLPYGAGYRLSVPNNALDLVGKAWSTGNYSMKGDANPATHRAMKTVRPTRFREGHTVHFLFRLSDPPSREEAAHVEALSAIAPNVVALGWGIDLVAARASVLSTVEVDALEGERWGAGASRGRGLRLPMSGTLLELMRRHRTVLDRIHGDIWRSPPAFTHFELRSYRRSGDVEERAWAAFTLRVPTDASRFRPFDPVRETAIVAGRLRHATHDAALASGPPAWPEAQIASFVLGHGEARGETHAPPGKRRFAYLPLPTIHARGSGAERSGAIRRVLLTTFADDCGSEVGWAAMALAGQELIDETTKEPVALLEPLGAEGDAILSRYAPPQGASTWASVTPVVLPGFDDPKHLRRRLAKGVGVEEQHRLVEQLDRRVDALLRRAIVHAGIAEDFARNAAIAWQPAGLFPGVEHASRYRVPSHLASFPRLHVRIQWRDGAGNAASLPGPLCIGGGRFFGIGLFAAMNYF